MSTSLHTIYTTKILERGKGQNYYQLFRILSYFVLRSMFYSPPLFNRMYIFFVKTKIFKGYLLDIHFRYLIHMHTHIQDFKNTYIMDYTRMISIHILFMHTKML